MIEINITELVMLMGIPSAITGFCFWLLERRIQRREKERDRLDEQRRKKAEDREKAREELELMIVQSNGAAIAISEATARAVQRIPDAHCNGEMHAALEYAAKVKHAQKDFLTRQGIQAILE